MHGMNIKLASYCLL